MIIPSLREEDELRVFRRKVDKPTDPNGLILEGWAQGFMVGSLIILSCITLANMRKGVLLHKLILLELLLGIWHGFWIFFENPIYSWWLSVSAIFLNMSWSLHNVIAWIKIKPFLSKLSSRIFILTVILVQPYWVVEIYANFAYFHNINEIFLRTRPWEALCRDPWWIYTTVALLYCIRVRYDLTAKEIVRISPRFGVMLGAMLLSIVFIVVDVLSVTGALDSTLPVGINPFWKLNFVFKCLTDAVVLDDFKTALDRLRAFKISRLGSFAMEDSDCRARADGELVRAWDSGRKAALAPPDTVPGNPFDASRSKRSVSGAGPGNANGWRPPYGRNASRDRDSQEDVVFDPSALVKPRSPKDTIGDPPPAQSPDDEVDWRDSQQSARSEYARAVKEMSNDTEKE